MRQHDNKAPQSAEKTARDIRRAARRHFSAEEKIRIVLEGLCGEDSIAELRRGEGIAQGMNTHWFLNVSDAQRKCDMWRQDYNEARPHSAIGQLLPAEHAQSLSAACCRQ